MNQTDQQALFVEAALKACADAFTKVGYQSWNCYLGAEALTARVDNDWLMLRGCSVRDQVDRDSLWQLLQWNRHLPGGVKFALIGCGALTHARAEIPLIRGVDLTARLQRACAGFLSAAQWKDSLPSETEHRDGTALAELARLCEEAGWPICQASDGRCTVELETGHGSYQANIHSSAGSILIGTEIAAGDAITPDCQEALAIFLLNTSRQLRMARPATVQQEGRVRARLEIVFDHMPAVEELGHGFGALSMGCRMAAAEAEALLEDQALVKQCLSVWRVDRPAVQTRPIGKSNHLTKAPAGAEKGAEPWIQQ